MVHSCTWLTWSQHLEKLQLCSGLADKHWDFPCDVARPAGAWLLPFVIFVLGSPGGWLYSQPAVVLCKGLKALEHDSSVLKR